MIEERERDEIIIKRKQNEKSHSKRFENTEEARSGGDQ